MKNHRLFLLWSVIAIAGWMSACAGGRTKPPCGDGICETGESWDSCPADCPPPCGDGQRQAPEECDAQDLGGATCESIGLGPGTLSCTPGCYFNTVGCGPCTDDCASTDAPSCDGNTLIACRQNNYTCWKWTRTDCTAASQVCDEGSGTARCADTCTDACTADQTRCVQDDLQTCGEGINGCLGFSTTRRCADDGMICREGACVCPEGACTPGSTRCSGAVVQSCVAQDNGCGVWQDGQDCAATGWLCDAGTGEARCVPDCTSTCSPENSRSCSGAVVQTCTLQPSGCLAPVDTEDCAATGRVCDAGACVCVHECADGQYQCSGNTRQRCESDANGCRRWVADTDCAAAGFICSQGECVCDNQCAEGQTRCSGNTPQTCASSVSGCWYWSSGTACNPPAEFCENGACHGYAMTTFAGTYAAITGGTSLTSADDDARFAISLPFTFYFYGQPFTQAWVCTNGWLSFGSDPGTNAYTNASAFPVSGAPNLALYPYWDDLNIDNYDCLSTTNLRWETQGTAPNRVVVIQWRDFCSYASTSVRGNMQIRLYETTNVIEFLYNRSQWSGSFTASIGIEDDARSLGITANGSISGAPSADFRFTPY